MILNPKKYRRPVAILRYGSGGFYGEESCELFRTGNAEFARVTSVINLSHLNKFAKLGVEIAQKHNLRLRVSSKWTIADSEALFYDRVVSVFDRSGFSHEDILPDTGMGMIATQLDGGWAWLFDNPFGDAATDIVEFVDGSRSMSSTVYCADGSRFEELPGGTAPDKFGTDLTGKNFFNPVGIINAFCTALAVVNPGEAEFFSRVHREADHYLRGTEAPDRSTYDMVDCMAERLAKHELA
jgi:isocitrate/isopropylmalate dehydrogenase